MEVRNNLLSPMDLTEMEHSYACRPLNENVNPSCANCSIELSHIGLRSTEQIFVIPQNDRGKVDPVSRVAALSLIYEPFLTSPPPEFELCWPCGKLMNQMFQVHYQFKCRSKPNSFLKRYLGQRQRVRASYNYSSATRPRRGGKKFFGADVGQLPYEYIDISDELDLETDCNSGDDDDTAVNYLYIEMENDVEPVVAKKELRRRPHTGTHSGTMYSPNENNDFEAESMVNYDVRESPGFKDNKILVQDVMKNSPVIVLSKTIFDDQIPGKTAKTNPVPVSSKPIFNVEDSSFKPRYHRYSGLCSEQNCGKFANASVADIENHFKGEHDRNPQFIVLCHICKKDLPICIRRRNIPFPKFSHLKTHPGDFEQNLNDMEKMNSKTLHSKCGLKLTRDNLTGKY